MSEVQIINEEAVGLFELKDHLDKLKKEKKEMNFRENKVAEYLHGIDILHKKKALELKKDLQHLDIGRFKERHIIKIIDLLPRNVEELKLILTGENLTLKADDLNKIIETVKKHV